MEVIHDIYQSDFTYDSMKRKIGYDSKQYIDEFILAVL